jgi:C_GCAxxG_C_C family probable redox protein
MTRKERAVALYKSGYNCAQAIAMTYSPVLEMTEETAAATFSGFGGGMGGQHLVCGAVSVMIAVLSKLMGVSDSSPAGKNKIYTRVREACKTVKDAHGSIICRDLLIEAKKTDDTPKPCSKYLETVCDEIEIALGNKAAKYFND